MLHIRKAILTLGVPLALSTFCVIRNSVLMFIILFLLHFLILKITPVFRHFENLGMFIIVAVSTIPINLHLIRLMIYEEFISDSFLLLTIVEGALFYVVVLSLEEIIMGTLTRLIWKKQYKSFV